MTPTLEDWLKEFPRTEVEQKVRELETDLARWRGALAMHDSLTAQDGAEPVSPGEQPTKPQAIDAVLRAAAGRPLSPGEIRDEMVKRGWLPPDAKARKRFYATMSRLNAEERIKRTPDGRYVLPETEGLTMPLT